MLNLKDVDLLILSKLDLKSLLAFSKASKKYNQLSNDENLWRKRFLKDFGEHEKTKERPWKNFYFKAFEFKNITPRYEFIYEPPKEGMKNIDIIKYYMTQCRYNCQQGMLSAAISGDQDLVDFFIPKIDSFINWNSALMYAAEGGSCNLVEFFISKGADNLNLGLQYAASNGHRDIVKFLIDKGADDWDSGVYGAAMAKDKELVNLFASKGGKILWILEGRILKDSLEPEMFEFLQNKIDGYH